MLLGENAYLAAKGGPKSFVKGEGKVSVCDTGWALSCVRVVQIENQQRPS